MKTTFTILLVILAVLACGCTTAAPPATPAAEPVIPDLVGTWTGPTQGYARDSGFTNYGNTPFSMVVTEQQGRIFAGHTLLILEGKTYTTPMAGVIGRDGRTLSIVEENNGYTNGEITAADTIELTWRKDTAPFSTAFDTLKRV